ncbi:unnamed protein product [Caretta caretta]
MSQKPPRAPEGPGTEVGEVIKAYAGAADCIDQERQQEEELPLPAQLSGKGPREWGTTSPAEENLMHSP